MLKSSSSFTTRVETGDLISLTNKNYLKTSQRYR